MKGMEKEAAEASERLETALRLSKEAVRLAQDGITTLERLKQAPLIHGYVSMLPLTDIHLMNEERAKSDEAFQKNMAVIGGFSVAFGKFLDAAGLLEDLSSGDTPGKRGLTKLGFHLTRDYTIDPLKV